MISEIPFVTLVGIALVTGFLGFMAYRAIRYGGAVGVLHGGDAELVGRTMWDGKHARMGVGVHRLTRRGGREKDIVLELIIAGSSTPLAMSREHAEELVRLLHKAMAGQ